MRASADFLKFIYVVRASARPNLALCSFHNLTWPNSNHTHISNVLVRIPRCRSKKLGVLLLTTKKKSTKTSAPWTLELHEQTTAYTPSNTSCTARTATRSDVRDVCWMR
jgi:hypothetical protein